MLPLVVTAFVLGATPEPKAAPGAAPALRALVSRVQDAYGGRPALEKARVVRQEGTVTSLMRGETGRLLRVFERPDSLRVEIAYPASGPEVRVVQGAYGRRGAREVGGPMHGAMVLQAARLALPLSLAGSGARIADHGLRERDGRKVHVVTQSLQDGMELEIEIDAASARIVRTLGSLTVPGGRIEFATIYSAFRSFEGVLFATHEENYARGQHTGSTDLARIELLANAPPGTFDEPL